MSKATSDILTDMHAARFQLDARTEAELAKLAAVAENIWEAPSARVKARTALADLYRKVERDAQKASKIAA